MDDPRLTPARPDLAAQYLKGKIKAARFVAGETFEIVDSIAPLRGEPSSDAMLLTQALKGERVTIYDRNGEGWAWGQLNSDGYVGWLPDRALAKPAAAPTHKITALRTFAFPGPSIKLPPVETLVMGTTLTVTARGRRFRRHPRGLVSAAAACRRHRPLRERFRRGRRAVRRHALSVGRQEQPRHRLFRPGADLADRRGHRLPARQRHAAGQPRQGTWTRRNPKKLQRGDLIFWKGHVAIARDADTIVHANAHHMATVIENTSDAIARIKAAGSEITRDQAAEVSVA